MCRIVSVCAMYPLFPYEPASIVELGCFRGSKVLIFNCFFVGFSRRETASTGGSWVATLGLDVSFLKGLGMRLIRSLSTFVLLGSVSWMLGCTANEDMNGAGGNGPLGNGGGSGVAGGAVMPHSHMEDDAHGEEVAAPETAAVPEEPKVEVPKVEAPKVEEPKVEEPKVEEPKVEEPKVEEPKVEEPKAE